MSRLRTPVPSTTTPSGPTARAALPSPAARAVPAPAPAARMALPVTPRSSADAPAPRAESLYRSDVQFSTLGEIRRAGLAALDPDVADFLESGSGAELTLRANRAAFARRTIVPRPMHATASPDTSTSFLGIPLAAPILTAPFGGDALFHRDGHLAVARANAAHGIASIVPEAGSFSLEAIAEAAPAAARILQLHPIDPVEHVVGMARRARRAGYGALCVTVDCPVGGWRTRNRENRFDPDLRHFAGNLDETGTIGVAELFGRLLDVDGARWDWARLREVAAEFELPWIAKGVLGADAAEQAIAAGASAIVVSNHGGRQLDHAPASLDVLPEVAEAVAGRVPIALDSGVRTGADVLLALALGADVVVLGRLTAYGLAAGGQHGVARTLELLTDELRTTMALAGVERLADLDARFVGGRPA